MSIFGRILEKLGLHPSTQAQANETAPTPVATSPTGTTTARTTAEPVRAVPMTEVDVAAKLEAMAKANPQKLNWKISIVDLLKLLDIDSSYEARKELARELDCPPGLIGNSAQMNTWLHKAVLQKLAANGGNVPEDLY